MRIKKKWLRDEIHTETKIKQKKKERQRKKESFIYYKMLFKLDIITNIW